MIVANVRSCSFSSGGGSVMWLTITIAAAETRKQEDDFKKLFGEVPEEPKSSSPQAAS